MAIFKGVKDKISVKVTAVIEVDNGKDVKSTFMVTFKKPTVEQSKEILAKLNPVDSDGDALEPEISDQELMDENVIGWTGVLDDEGQQVDFDADNLASMMDSREYRTAMVQGFVGVLLGRDAVAKNSSKRGGRGR